MTNLKLIELYLADELPISEKTALEERFKHDQILQADFRLYMLVQTILHLGIKERNKEKFAQWHEELRERYPNRTSYLKTVKKSFSQIIEEEKVSEESITTSGHEIFTHNPTSRVRLLKIAAAILVLVGVFLPFRSFDAESALTQDKLIAEHVSIPRSERVKSVDPDPSTKFKLDSLAAVGVKHFRNEAYEEALSVYQTRYSLSLENTDLLYEGVALLRLGRYVEAIAILQSGPKVGNLADQFKWHLVVAYFSIGDQDAFINAICTYEDSYQRSTIEKLITQEKISCEN